MKENKHDIIPTKSELEILQVLWQRGPSTVRFVNDILNEQGRDVQYTGTLKMMQVMATKGLLSRDESEMKHLYSAAIDEKSTKGAALTQFMNMLFEGSSSKLVMQIIDSKKPTKEEIKEIKNLINKLDNKK
jgi:predicted transcriptional regulator